MKLPHPNFGLVLTGGGAKGAYQAGALQYLAELNLKPTIIAGTSIGALNGAVLASYPDFREAVNQLHTLWTELADAPILRPHTGAVAHTLSYTAQTFFPNFRSWINFFLSHSGLLPSEFSIFDPQPIEEIVKQMIQLEALKQGTELWVTVFPSLKIPFLNYDILLDFIRAKIGTEAHWLCVQDCPDSETLYNLLLASAAIPLAFPRREINKTSYVDGGLANNVPIEALVARGCTHVIVIHLQDGIIWNRHDFPAQTVIEIRPEERINKSDIPVIGKVDTFLDFSATRIADLQQRGYEDAKRCLEPIIQTFMTVGEQRQTNNSLIDSTQQLLNDAPL